MAGIARFRRIAGVAREALHAAPGIRSTPVNICFWIFRQKHNVNGYSGLEGYTAQAGLMGGVDTPANDNNSPDYPVRRAA